MTPNQIRYLLTAIGGFVAGLLIGFGVTAAVAQTRIAMVERERDSALSKAAKAALDLTQERTAWTEASRKSTEQQAEIERQRREQHTKEIAYVQDQMARQVRTAGVLRGIVEQLRKHITRLAAGAGAGSQDPAAAGGSEAAAGPGLVLNRLCGGALERAAELAAFADRAHAAGKSCERSYDSLRTSQ